MLQKVPDQTLRAIEARDTFDRAARQDGKSVGWFANICKGLFALKAGLQLHYITGFEERSCQRYAAGTTEPPGDFVRAFLRSEQGGTFLAAIMDGSEAAWWRDLQRAERIA